MWIWKEGSLEVLADRRVSQPQFLHLYLWKNLLSQKVRGKDKDRVWKGKD
jgi:hypothetical protein